MIERILNLREFTEDSIFLWGARQTGKSTMLMEQFRDAKYYDLLESDLYERFRRKPAMLRQELEMADSSTVVIIDEIQKIER